MIKNLIKMLHDGNHSLVVGNGDTSMIFDGRGVSDLYRLYTESPEMLNGASVADKIVGKGAAALTSLGGVRQVYADVISTAALKLLRSNNVEVSFADEVPNIINRAGTGVCPVEILCKHCATAAECLPLITDFLMKMKKSNK